MCLCAGCTNKFDGDQEEPTEVIQATKAPNLKPEVAHAPDEEELIAVARAPEEVLDINEALQQMNEVFAEARPSYLSELIENASQEVEFPGPAESHPTHRFLDVCRDFLPHFTQIRFCKIRTGFNNANLRL